MDEQQPATGPDDHAAPTQAPPAEAPPTQRSRAKQNRRQALLSAAAALFAAEGFNRVSLEDLGSAAGVSGLVEVVLDNPANSAVGSFAVGNTGGWSTWKTIPANITKVTGTHNVYLKFVAGAGGNPPCVSLHYFTFPVS